VPLGQLSIGKRWVKEQNNIVPMVTLGGAIDSVVVAMLALEKEGGHLTLFCSPAMGELQREKKLLDTNGQGGKDKSDWRASKASKHCAARRSRDCRA